MPLQCLFFKQSKIARKLPKVAEVFICQSCDKITEGGREKNSPNFRNFLAISCGLNKKRERVYFCGNDSFRLSLHWMRRTNTGLAQFEWRCTRFLFKLLHRGGNSGDHHVHLYKSFCPENALVIGWSRIWAEIGQWMLEWKCCWTVAVGGCGGGGGGRGWPWPEVVRNGNGIIGKSGLETAAAAAAAAATARNFWFVSAMCCGNGWLYRDCVAANSDWLVRKGPASDTLLWFEWKICCAELYSDWSALISHLLSTVFTTEVVATFLTGGVTLFLESTGGFSFVWSNRFDSQLFTSTAEFVFSSCSFRICFLRSKFLQKPLPQVWHWNGFLSLWVCYKNMEEKNYESRHEFRFTYQMECKIVDLMKCFATDFTFECFLIIMG